MSKTLTIVLPERSEDTVSDGLRILTKALEDRFDTDRGYGLGGSSGYGVTYENDTFMMHRFCWCESEDCPWCGDENAPNFHHKPSGFKVWWYKYIGRGMEVSGQMPDLPKMLVECIDSATTPPANGG